MSFKERVNTRPTPTLLMQSIYLIYTFSVELLQQLILLVYLLVLLHLILFLHCCLFLLGRRTFAPHPTITLFPKSGCRLFLSFPVPPKVTLWYIVQSFPIVAVSPITIPIPWSINSFLPIFAPGWISIPVKNLPSCEFNLARKNSLCLYKKCDILWNTSIWKPWVQDYYF